MVKFGLFGSVKAIEDKGKELLDILIKASIMMVDVPSCLEYAVSVDQDNTDIIHIFELWDSQEAHDAALQKEKVRELIGQAKPLLSENQLPSKKMELKHSFNY